MPFNLTRLIVQERFLKFTKEDMQEIAVSCYEMVRSWYFLANEVDIMI